MLCRSFLRDSADGNSLLKADHSPLHCFQVLVDTALESSGWKELMQSLRADAELSNAVPTSARKRGGGE